MNLKEIKEIINLMNENNLSEIEVEREGSKIKIKRTSPDVPDAIRIHPPQYQVESLNGTSQVEFPSSAKKESNKNTVEITSPMVGTFYRAPSPESPSFVELGDIVEIGQVVCIVEAMKLMNEIKSEVKGKIAEVAVENAEPVEFGQPLFIVEPL